MILNYFSVYFFLISILSWSVSDLDQWNCFCWFRVCEICFVEFVVNFKQNFRIPRRILTRKHQILTVISTHLFNSFIPSIAFIGYTLHILIQSYAWSEEKVYLQKFCVQTVTKLLWSFFSFYSLTIWCKNEIVNPVYKLRLLHQSKNRFIKFSLKQHSGRFFTIWVTIIFICFIKVVISVIYFEKEQGIKMLCIRQSLLENGCLKERLLNAKWPELSGKTPKTLHSYHPDPADIKWTSVQVPQIVASILTTRQTWLHWMVLMFWNLLYRVNINSQPIL